MLVKSSRLYFLKFPLLICTACALVACGGGSSGSFGNDNNVIDYGDEVFYDFEEESGAVAYNRRFDEYHGSISGASRVDGKVGKGLYFGDDLPSYVSFSKGPELTIGFPEGTFSIEMWINFESIDLDETYHLFGNVGAGLRNFVFEVNQGQLKFTLYTPYDPIELAQTDMVLSVDTWYHVAITYDGSTSNLYVDGIEEDTRNISAPIEEIYNTLYLGGGPSHDSVNSFPGYIDELRFTSSLRSQAEIQAYIESVNAD
jgi:hypothetical protein